MKTEMQAPAHSQRVAIRNILVMTDFSPRSEAALNYAAGWARKLGASIHVAHFIRPALFAVAWDAYGPLMEKVFEEGRAGLAAIDARPDLQDIPHATYLDPGEILDGLKGLIEAQHVDLVVLASAARKGLGKVFLGSTAETVFRSVPNPVLMLGPSVRLPEKTSEVRTVLFATDFGPTTARAAMFACSLAQELQARLYLLHVLPLPGVENAPRKSEVAVAERQLSALVPPGAESWCEPVPLIRAGNPATEIVKAADATQADLIVVGTRRPPRLPVYTGWATAYQVLHEAPCPVLTVRE